MNTIKGEFVFISENVLAVAVHFFACFILDLKKDKINNFNEYCDWKRPAMITFEEWDKISLNKVKNSIDAQNELLEIVTSIMDYEEVLQAGINENFIHWQDAKLNPPPTKEERGRQRAEYISLKMQSMSPERALQEMLRYLNE
ncbi:MAG: hypothetical protein NTY31_02910 [Candidatus Falkowbacteria bacterium]|nr:hypothetical protein [Candidatus Falkowbacteria bacterium]